jgi:hypothetical protein
MTYGKALTLLCSSPNVHMLDAKKADFKAYGHFFNLLYKKFPTEKIFKNHIFVASTIDGDGVPIETLDMVRHDYVTYADFAVWMKEYGIPCLLPPGIKDIKAVKLYTKYRQLLLEEDKDETFPMPPDGAAEHFKDTKKRKEVAVDNRPARALRKIKKPTAKQPTKANKNPKDPTHTKRPATAYIFFCKAKDHTFKAEKSHVTFGKVSKLCGEAFKILPNSERVIYTAQKEAYKKRYDAEMATWLLKKSVSASVGTASAAGDRESTETDVGNASSDVDTQAT